ncbi:MAG: hypothetical protein CM15mV12_1140 [uncultured marine virus]|nr:MAG: hypothetical protein CM15mV12_1140 [uncultured marine virus]
MSLMDRMKAGFSTLFGTTRRTSHLQSLLRVTRNIKSSSLTKQTIPLPTSAFSERVLRSSLETVDLSSLATIRTKLLTLHSRCAVVEFGIKGRHKQEIAAAFFGRLIHILDQERIDADKKVLAELINKHFPDWRRVLNECQRYQ